MRRQVFPILFILVAQARTGSMYGLFGSYGRGTAADGPQYQRLLQWPLAQLPLSCVALVLTPGDSSSTSAVAGLALW